MPRRRGVAKQTTNTHNSAYWDKLRRQFESCSYANSGAYRSTGNGKSEEMSQLETDINSTEESVQHPTYAHMKRHGHFRPRASDRLLPLVKLRAYDKIMFVFVASVHHTGTQFTQKLFVDLDYEVTDKLPGETENNGNYFHRCHISDSCRTELNEWLHRGVPLIVPLRHPLAVMRSWLARGKSVEEMCRQFELLFELVDPHQPLYLPLDSPLRDKYFTNLRLKVDLSLNTDWAKWRSKMKGSDHPAQLEPVTPTDEQMQMLEPVLKTPLMTTFYWNTVI